MKRKLEHPAPSERAQSGPRYWRSLGELASTPGFKASLEREFPEGAASLDGVDRRQFMKIMAASFALGGVGLAGCRRPESNILPFGKSVEGVIPGLPLYYATSMALRRWAIPLLAETHQGRPTKVEGNPAFPGLGGVSSLKAQASLLDLYDPDRAAIHTSGGATIDAAAVRALLASVGSAQAADGGRSLAFLAESSGSPTRARLVGLLRDRFPKAVWAEYEPVTDEAPVEAALAAFGSAVRPVYHFAKARRIVSLDADFLHAEAGSLHHVRDFSAGRRVTGPSDSMNRLYVVESALTITGGMADHRKRLATSHMTAFAAALAARVTGDAGWESLVAGLDVTASWISECAQDLLDNAGASLVVAGAHLPAAAHALVHAINAAIGAAGATVDYLPLLPDDGRSVSTISDLAARISAGSVGTLVILGGNPAYNAPADLGWADLQARVPQVIRHGYYADETSAHASVTIAAAHYLESWGDARAIDGTVLPVQPMILPLFGGLTETEVLASLCGSPHADSYSLVLETFGPLAGASGPEAEKAFQRFLHDGYLAGSAQTPATVTLDSAGVRRLAASVGRPAPLSAAALEVRFTADFKVDDGRFVNNGWLQECPDPVTKLTWDNAILVSPRLARELGIDPARSLIQVARKEGADFDQGRENAHVLEVRIGDRTLRGPAHIQPGLSNYTLVLPLGYGRSVTGRIGHQSGFNAYALRTSSAPHVVVGATVTVTGEKVYLADTQQHWSMEGRDLVREANIEEYRKTPDFVKEMSLEAHSPSVLGAPGDKIGEEGELMTPAQRASEIPRGGSLYSTPKFDGIHQWGMSIDLNTCVGCNACVVACQSENNIPIIGREQVLRGRSMHWIRLDRYYSDGKADAAAFGGEGNLELPEEPQISIQPVACMQCELAPCETVCPVNATVHDDEGLNVMAYNRCIGTRYCANNCPYKVRRFNFFDWNQRSIDSLYLGPLGPKGMPELVKMAKNPEVTVRMRGVMEKCTYCVQRIENGKIQWKVAQAQAGHPEDVSVADGHIRTACQQACPAGSIVFGNILDPESAVSKAKARAQDYALLGYLNIRPRTTYLARLRNPNPKMPDYAELPLSRVENVNKNHPASAAREGPSASASLPSVGGLS